MAYKAEPPRLSHYVIPKSSSRGYCLLIDNVSHSAREERRLQELFEFLSFEVVVKKNLSLDAINNLAQEYGKKDHRQFHAFVVIILSDFNQRDEISGFDNRHVSLKSLMAEFKASRCPTLRDKPKLFFVQHFKRISCSPSRSYEGKYPDATPSLSISPCCPEEADFLLTCVTSTCHAGGEPVSLFLQIFDEVVRKYDEEYHLLEMLTMVNKEMMKRRNSLPNIEIPCRSYTLRKRVYLGSTPPSAPITRVPQDSYEMNKDPQGLCLIVNNLNFERKDLDRPGASKDQQSLLDLFQKLSFDVKLENNLTTHELERKAREFGARDHGAYNAFVFIVMSHGGDGDSILCIDERDTTVKNLMLEFHERRCPSLKDKPKIFIIQTCRGNRVDASDCSTSSSSDDSSSQVVTTSQEVISSQPYDNASSSDSTLPKGVIPPGADFVLSFATAPDYVAYRDDQRGTPFIQTLVEVIRKYHPHHHFHEILTEVTKLVVERDDKHVQVPAPTDTLTKFLFLKEVTKQNDLL